MSPQPIPKRLYVLIAVCLLATLYSCGESLELEKMFFDPDPDYFDYRITSPNGGEVWSGQSEHEIIWSSGEYVSDRVEIFYSKDAGSHWSFIDHVNNVGSYSWTVPEIFINSSNCQIKIVDWDDEDIFDISDNNFTISSGSSESLIRITSPNGGEIWHEQSTQTISWVVSGDIGADYVTILYSQNDGNDPYPSWGSPFIYWSTIVYSTLNDGLYDWTLPNISELNDSCILAISSTSQPNIYDITDDYFHISADQNYFQIQAPNGGEIYTVGSQYEVVWSSGGDVGSYVKFYYSTDGGSGWYTIASQEQNDGSFMWTIPTIISSSNTCVLKIESYYDSEYYDVSDSYFTINS